MAVGLDVGSYCAECVSLDVKGREVIVDRVVAAIDCGLVMNPSGVDNQVEGAIVMGLGTALYEGAEFEGGRLLNGSFSRYRVPRIRNTPRIEVVQVGDDSTPPTGAGEPGIVPIAPAIANAVYDKTGVRYRELPIQRQLR
jgi:CO/xanthine dehydrogenase Mo-binding subunit